MSLIWVHSNVGRGCLLWPVRSLAKLLAFALLYLVLQGQTCLLLQVSSWLPACAFQSPMKKGTFFFFFFLLFYKVLQLFIEQFNLSLFSVSVWGIDFDYYDVEWFALEMNPDHSSLKWDWVIFDVAPEYCILDSFVDSEVYSISSKGFLPAIWDIMIIWIKLIHYCAF